MPERASGRAGIRRWLVCDSLKPRACGAILDVPVEVFLFQIGDAFEVHVVGDVVELDASRDRIRFAATDELVVALAVAVGHGIDGGDDLGCEARVGKILGRSVGVFDDVVEHADDPLFVGPTGEHDADGMEHVGLAILAFLAPVGGDGERDGVLDMRVHRRMVSGGRCAGLPAVVAER